MTLSSLALGFFQGKRHDFDLSWHSKLHSSPTTGSTVIQTTTTTTNSANSGTPGDANDLPVDLPMQNLRLLLQVYVRWRKKDTDESSVYHFKSF